MKIFIGSDHRGYKLKEKVKEWLNQWAFEYEDLGNEVYDTEDDYVDFAVKVGEGVSLGESKGVLMCGSGAGMDLTVNKIRGVRGVLGFNVNQVKESVEKDNVNVLSLSANHVSLRKTKKILKVFLETEFLRKEKYLRRIKKIEKIERIYD